MPTGVCVIKIEEYGFLIDIVLLFVLISTCSQSACSHFHVLYLLTNWLAYLYGRIQSPRPDVMPDRREGITRAAGFVFACIDTQTS